MSGSPSRLKYTFRDGQLVDVPELNADGRLNVGADGFDEFRIPAITLVFPGGNEKFHKRAIITKDVFEIVPDLQDGIAPVEKVSQRETLVRLLQSLDYGSLLVTPRINAIGSRWWEDDIAKLVSGAPNRFHALYLPNVDTPETVKKVAYMLAPLERKAGWKWKLRLACQIESPLAAENAFEIAKVDPRVVTLTLGRGDYGAANRMRFPTSVEEQIPLLGWIKSRIANAAHAVRPKGYACDTPLFLFPPKDAPDSSVDEVGKQFALKNLDARGRGMEGTWVLSPDHVKWVAPAFVPNEFTVEQNLTIINDWITQGGGAVLIKTRDQTGCEHEFMYDTATILDLIVEIVRACGLRKLKVPLSLLTELESRWIERFGEDVIAEVGI